MSVSKVKRGDIGRVITTTLTADGVPVDLANADAVRFLARRPYATEPLIVEAAIVDPDQVANRGKVTYITGVDDFAKLGPLLVEWEVTRPDESVETYPSADFDIIEVVPDVA